MLKLMLYMNARTRKRIRIALPRRVSNKYTNNPGIANITTHRNTRRVISPTTRFKFLRDNILDIFLFL